jgi:hypothetical protein
VSKQVRTKIRHSRMLLAGIQASPELDPRLKHSGVDALDRSPHLYPLHLREEFLLTLALLGRGKGEG